MTLIFDRNGSSSDSALVLRPPRPRPREGAFLTGLGFGLAIGMTTGFDLPLAACLYENIDIRFNNDIELHLREKKILGFFRSAPGGVAAGVARFFPRVVTALPFRCYFIFTFIVARLTIIFGSEMNQQKMITAVRYKHFLSFLQPI